MMNKKKKKKLIQSNISNVYFSKNPILKFIFRQRIIDAIRLAGDVSNKKIIDVGCGAGILSYNLAMNNGKVVGFDIHKGNLRKIRSIYNDYIYFYLINGNVIRIPFKSHSFDVLFALDVLEHIKDIDTVLAEIKRILKTGGLLVVSIPNENALYKLGRRIARFNAPSHVSNADELIYRLNSNFNQVKKIGIPTSLIPNMDLFKIILYMNKNE